MKQFNLISYFDSLKHDKNKMLIVAAISAAVLLFDYSFLLKAQLSWLTSVSAKIVKERQELETATRDVAKLKSGGAGNAKAMRFKKMVSEDRIEDLMEEIDKIAKENRINIIQAKRSKEEKTSRAVKAVKGKPVQPESNSPLLIILDVSGDYHDLGAFINAIEHGQTLALVEEVAISADSDNYLLQNALISLKTFVKK